MSKVSHEQGFIYVYPCIMGGCKTLSKIGVTNNLKARMTQHLRTPYQGFTCAVTIPDYKPIVTAFKVKYMDEADRLIKDKDTFSEIQLSGFEVYNMNYKIAIQELFNLLNEHGQYLGRIDDGITDYSFLKLEEDIKIDTSKKVFEALRDKILLKYKKTLPEDLIAVLRDKEEFERHCPSHKSFIEFRDGLILDISVSRPSRVLLLEKLHSFL